MKITVKIRDIFGKNGRGYYLRRNFAILRFFFVREQQDSEIWFIIKVHVLNFEKYICILFIFILI
jgi:hypothetical protein